jgi:hypothetical protein
VVAFGVAMTVITGFQRIKNKAVIYNHNRMERETVENLAFVSMGWGCLRNV